MFIGGWFSNSPAPSKGLREAGTAGGLAGIYQSIKLPIGEASTVD